VQKNKKRFLNLFIYTLFWVKSAKTPSLASHRRKLGLHEVPVVKAVKNKKIVVYS